MRLIFTLLLLVSFSPGFSQGRHQHISCFIEGGGGMATGITTNVYNSFIDPRIGISFSLSNKVALNANLGYVYFFRKTKKAGVSFLPLAAGIDYALVSKLFLEMQIGGAMILDGTDELYLLAEPGGGWQFNRQHSVRVSYYGFIAQSVTVGGINLAYRFHF